MHIYSLTTERVLRLKDQRVKKEAELNAFLKRTAKDLWIEDLDELMNEWEEVLEDDIRVASKEVSMKKKKGASSKFAKASRKRASDAADGEYMERKPKVAKTKATSSPKQSKITSFASKAAKVEGVKTIHTAAFTSVNKAGESASTTAKRELISKVKPMLIDDDDDDFDLLVKGVRAEEKPITIDLLSPSTAVKPKKTFSIPGLKKPAAPPLQKSRQVSKSKAVKRKEESEDEESFSFMADDREPIVRPAAERRPARAAATKAKAIVLTSDDVYDEDDTEDEEDEEDED